MTDTSVNLLIFRNETHKEMIQVAEDVLPKTGIYTTLDELLKAMNKGSKLVYDNSTEKLDTFNDDGERIECPDLSREISVAAE
jgi:hypothetical protein